MGKRDDKNKAAEFSESIVITGDVLSVEIAFVEQFSRFARMGTHLL